MHEIGFIGGGNMAEAIVRSAIAAGVLESGQIVVADPSEARRRVMTDLGVDVAATNAEVVGSSKQIVLAVKPQAAAEPAAEIGATLTHEQVVISIMAGVTTAKLAAMIRAGMPSEAPGLGEPSERRVRVVRVMPNTPLMVGKGMSGVSLGTSAEPGDDELAMKLLLAGGAAVRVEESMLDAITAVSGSGPAYLFYLATAMEKAAHELGLGEHASLLVGQTLGGAADMLARSGDDAATLCEKVASPGGTTEAALKTLEAAGVGEAMVRAIQAAEARSRELGA